MQSFFSDDTICAPATASGGAVGIVRVSGPRALELADSIFVSASGKKVLESAGYSILYGEIPGVDQVLVSVFKAPHSYTGEDSVEIGCHGSSFIVSRILEKLVEAGARMAEPGEFTRRAFVGGKMDLAQAEAVADIVAASGAAAHRAALNQLKGGFSSELRELRNQIVEITALMELELDFSEEDVEFADRSRLKELLERTLGHIAGLADSFSKGNAVRNGVPVAIAGAPNSGKSTLLNALLGDDRAIVSDIPGTTRDTVEEVMNLDGVLYRFIDTAGLRETPDVVEAMGVERSLAAIGRAQVVIGVIDATAPLPCLQAQAAELASRVGEGQKFVIALNKVDLNGADRLALSGIADGLSGVGEGLSSLEVPVVPISAKTGYGLDELKAAIRISEPSDGSETLVTSLRHYQALMAASEDLSRVRTGLDSCIPSDLLAQDLRSAIYSLNSILGEVTSDEVLGEIFGKFCIGK